MRTINATTSQNQPADIEVNVTSGGSKTVKTKKFSQQKPPSLTNGIRDNTTTDLALPSHEAGTLAPPSDISSHQVNQSSPLGGKVQIVRDIDMWGSLDGNEQIDCTHVISMLDEIRRKYELMFNVYKNQRCN